MMTVDVHVAQAYLSELIERAAQGEEVVIVEAGKPVARIVPAEPSRAPRPPGSARGLGQVRDDLDAPIPDDFLAAFG
jgi:prevent-host-death family protein